MGGAPRPPLDPHPHRRHDGSRGLRYVPAAPVGSPPGRRRRCSPPRSSAPGPGSGDARGRPGRVLLRLACPGPGRAVALRDLPPGGAAAAPGARLAGREPPGGGRAVNGWAGGDGYAARHPGMFAAAASLQRAAAHPLPGRAGVPGPQLIQGLLGDFGEDPGALWDDPRRQGDAWAEHNPYDLASRLRGVRLFVSFGNGQRGPLDTPGVSGEGRQIERNLYPQTSPSSSGCASSASLSGPTPTVPAPTTGPTGSGSCTGPCPCCWMRSTGRREGDLRWSPSPNHGSRRRRTRRYQVGATAAVAAAGGYTALYRLRRRAQGSVSPVVRNPRISRTAGRWRSVAMLAWPLPGYSRSRAPGMRSAVSWNSSGV